MRLADYFDAASIRHADKPALIEGDLEISFAEAQRLMHAVAHALKREPGLGERAHIAVYSPNHIRLLLILLGINRSDNVWLSAHPRNPVAVNAQVLEFMDCEFMFFHSSFESAVSELKARLPKVRRFICIDAESVHGVSLDRWLEGHWEPFRAGPEEPMAEALLQPTGGTTGPSKAAVHTHRSMELSTLATIEVMRITPRSRYLAVAPLSHAGGFLALNTLVGGGSVVVMTSSTPVDILAAVQRHQATSLFVPPTLLYQLMAEPRFREFDLASLQLVIIGAAPSSPEKFKEAVRLFGPIMHEAFGQTECSSPLTSKGPEDYLRPDGSFDEEVLRSAGRAVTMARLEIMDDDGHLLPAGERGELVVQSSMVMREYYKNPEETAVVARHGWRHTGDVAIKDARGYITIVDRLKDMIVSGGFNIYPAQIEAVIQGHPAVLDCAVVGVPDEKWGEAVKAVIQLKEGQSTTSDAIVALCKSKLGSVYAPKTVEFWPSLPRSAVGKLLRRQVREKFWQGQWRAV